MEEEEEEETDERLPFKERHNNVGRPDGSTRDNLGQQDGPRIKGTIGEFLLGTNRQVNKRKHIPGKMVHSKGIFSMPQKEINACTYTFLIQAPAEGQGFGIKIDNCNCAHNVCERGVNSCGLLTPPSCLNLSLSNFQGMFGTILAVHIYKVSPM